MVAMLRDRQAQKCGRYGWQRGYSWMENRVRQSLEAQDKQKDRKKEGNLKRKRKEEINKKR